ncbi:uncharacterized protein LOC129912052 [Episyrphus balteatus]|uniref:uncharacterized protein LOC129912052 n=1 Tax=Episyrphus balteatus TaxID=286459 RepID=UPI00248552AB|nr:uncharacterized protein LOC129912052 [Episyrphus balteatus]
MDIETSRRFHRLMHNLPRSLLISENDAIRLFNSVNTASTFGTIESAYSLMSIHSSNELGNSCRICRWHQADLQIVQCPCECKGSVGYIHLKCLRRWILQRGENRCEICGKVFKLNTENRSYKQMFRSFFQHKYFGEILKNCIHLVTLAPISYLILFQVMLKMDNLQIEKNYSLEIIFLTPTLLLTSSVIFLNILEFGLTRCLRIKNVLRHWWTFGGQETDPGIDMEVPSDFFELF